MRLIIFPVMSPVFPCYASENSLLRARREFASKPVLRGVCLSFRVPARLRERPLFGTSRELIRFGVGTNEHDNPGRPSGRSFLRPVANRFATGIAATDRYKAKRIATGGSSFARGAAPWSG